MKTHNTRSAANATAHLTEAWDVVQASFERFCLTAGVATLTKMMEQNPAALCGGRYGRLKAHRQLPTLRDALAAHQAKYAVKPTLDRHAVAA